MHTQQSGLSDWLRWHEQTQKALETSTAPPAATPAALPATSLTGTAPVNGSDPDLLSALGWSLSRPTHSQTLQPPPIPALMPPLRAVKANCVKFLPHRQLTADLLIRLGEALQRCPGAMEEVRGLRDHQCSVMGKVEGAGAIKLLRRFTKKLIAIEPINYSVALQRLVKRISYSCIKGLADQLVRRTEWWS